jgi:hypothetical protein
MRAERGYALALMCLGLSLAANLEDSIGERLVEPLPHRGREAMLGESAGSGGDVLLALNLLRLPETASSPPSSYLQV